MRLLVATDGSPDATAAVRWVQHLPLPADREVMVITVVHRPRWALPSRNDVSTLLVGAARQLADTTASQLMTGRRAVGRVVEGEPREAIVGAARDWDADLVVLGARGLGAIRELLVGSVSLGVVREAPCPVLVCKGRPRPIKTVTVALDGSGHARQALAWFARLPLLERVRVRLVGVVEPQRHPAIAGEVASERLGTSLAAVEAERRAALDKELSAAARVVRERVRQVDVSVATGAPAVRIVAEAERRASDLIVVGARGVGGARRFVLGSVSEAVLRRAACPVLVVRRTPSPADPMRATRRSRGGDAGTGQR